MRAKIKDRVTRLVRALSGRDRMEGFRLLRRFGRTLVPEYRFKWPHMAWWKDDDFTRFLDRFGELHGLNSDRRWMIQQLIRLVDSIPGDTAECGVFKGAGSYLIARSNMLSQHARKHHSFDSFQGLSAPVSQDGDYWQADDLSTSEEEFKRNLAEFADRVVVYSGWIPDTFAGLSDDLRFAFVHIDVDLYQPTLDSLTYFYPRLSPGAIVLCDDYGFTTCPGATRAVDEFLDDKPEKMIALSAGSGFFIKGTRTQRSIHSLG